MEGQRIGVRFLAGAASGSALEPYQGIKRLGREADHSPPSSKSKAIRVTGREGP
jgi:hypothetical protein